MRKKPSIDSRLRAVLRKLKQMRRSQIARRAAQALWAKKEKVE
jgi:hypothetical protein